MTTQTMKSRRNRPDALRLLLLAGLSVQAWGLLMGVGILVLNLAA